MGDISKLMDTIACQAVDFFIILNPNIDYDFIDVPDYVSRLCVIHGISYICNRN